MVPLLFFLYGLVMNKMIKKKIPKIGETRKGKII